MQKTYLQSPQFFRFSLLLVLIFIELLMVGDVIDLAVLINEQSCCRGTVFFTQNLIYLLVVLMIYIFLLVFKNSKVLYFLSLSLVVLSIILVLGFSKDSIREYRFMLNRDVVLISPKEYWSDKDNLTFNINLTLPTKEVAQSYYRLRGLKYLYLNESDKVIQFIPIIEDEKEREYVLLADAIQQRAPLYKVLQFILMIAFLLLVIRFSYRDPKLNLEKHETI